VKDVFEKGGKGKFFLDGYPFIYLPEEKEVIRFQDDSEANQLLGKMRLRIKQRDTDLVRENLRAHIMEFGEPTRVEKLGCLRGAAIYVNNGRGSRLRRVGGRYDRQHQTARDSRVRRSARADPPHGAGQFAPGGRLLPKPTFR
jgi:hypothetical protein